QPLENRGPGGRLEIQGQAPLAPIDRHEVARLATDERRPLARVVALAGLLDLDHVGSHVAEHHRGERTGPDAREVQHADAAQRLRRAGTSCRHWEGPLPFQTRLARLRVIALTRSPAWPVRRQNRRARSRAPRWEK